MSWAVNSDRFVSYTLSTKRDWLCSSFRLQFYHLACLKFNAELFLFVIFSTFFYVLVQLFFIYRLSFRSLRNHHLTLFFFIDDHDAMIVKWSSTRKKNCWKKKHRLSCVVLRVRLWIEKKWKSRKFWELWSNFDLKKESLTLYLTIRSSINLFCQFSSKWNDVVFIEKNEKWL